MPEIQDFLQRLEGFQYATAIDLSMGYGHIPLDKESQELCSTILPWGIYQYQRLPMGISISPDIFQGIMIKILGNLKFCNIYLDNILITSYTSYENHLNKISEVLKQLQTVGFTASGLHNCHSWPLLKHGPYILHLFQNCFVPEVCPRFHINSQSFFNRVRQLDSKFVSCLPILTIDLCNN